MTFPVSARWLFRRLPPGPRALAVFLCLTGSAWANPGCPIPEALALRDIDLPAARQAVGRDHRLIILTLGGAHTAGADAGSDAATYPARLEAALRDALPGTDVRVVNEAVPRNTAADIPPVLRGLIEKTGARLVIWGPGGRDVALRLDQREFQNAVTAGIDAARLGGVDLILLDTTFVPSPTRMALIEPYRDRLKRAALESRIPFLPRHDLMLRWSKDGTLNLEAREPAEQARIARHLFACMAQSLAEPIAAAVRGPR